MEKKNDKLAQSSIKENDIRSAEQDKNLPFNNNNSDTKSAHTLIPNYIDFLPRQSTCNCIKQVLYPGQIAFGFEFLPKTSIKELDISQSSRSANFVSSRAAKSHEHMI